MVDTTEEENTPNTDPLGMSDAEFLNAPEPTGERSIKEEPPVSEVPDIPKQEEEQEENTPSPTDEVDETKNEEKVTEDPDEEPGEAKGDEEGDDVVKDKEEVPEKVSKKKVELSDNKDNEKSEESETIDYKAEYERLLQPFKANGRQISVKSVDDAISLMQMGANYNKRMASLKPNLKIIKLLENNQLLDENKLSYLIDLDKKDPIAINKLIKESGIDPADLDIEKASEYTPKSHNITDSEIDLDTVLDEIQDTPTYNRTINIVSKQWDTVSKQAIANQPQILKLINEHIESGIYDIINDEIENERVLGRLSGVSDIEAYKSIGERIQSRGGFDHLSKPQSKSNDPAPVVVEPKPKANDDPVVKDKRKAAGSVPATAPAAVNVPNKNPLSLSDDEFLKLSANG